jgi:asparagine synthase (glutamine-hydrolysing)
MCAVMEHRGPDDGGCTTVGIATLGMRRLAIFDPANGRQPMQTADGRFTLIFNGAIYNFRELRSELAAAGETFRTNCDTEVLLAAYARWGEACLRRLRGMFAFAVWDAREQSLFLARDPFGIKPLYYQHRADGRLVWASELNALRAAGLIASEIDPQAAADCLAWLAVAAPRTIYRGVFSLQPGECAQWRAGRLEVRTAWSFQEVPVEKPCANRLDFQRELRVRLDDTIRAHELADVPVGAFLSGGLDSAVIVGLMSRASRTRLKTFSIGFDEETYSEAEPAAATARHFGTDHYRTVLTGEQVARDMEKILATMDQPTGDGINTYYVSQAARRGGVTVALSGLGGDELFGSYPSFHDLPKIARWLPLWRTLPAMVQRPIIDRLKRGDTRARKLADFLAHAHNLNELCALQRRVFANDDLRTLLSPEASGQLNDDSPFHSQLATLEADLAHCGAFETISAWELRTYMADVLLRDSDVMSMRHSLELRVPFIDRPFIEWLWNQPAKFKHETKGFKRPLAAAVIDLLPPEIMQRKKWGFTLPLAVWMRRELRPFLEDTFSSESIERSGLFSADTVQARWKKYLAHDDTREWSRIWSLAILIAFANRRPAKADIPGAGTGAVVQTVLRPAARHRFPVSSHQPGSVGINPGNSDPARMKTLLLSPELFTGNGGIPRILRLYLKSLCDLAGPEGNVRFVTLNDRTIEAAELRRYSTARLGSWEACQGQKIHFIRAAFRLSRGCDRIVCGHVFLLPVALAARCLRRKLSYDLVAHGIEVWRPFSLAERLALRGARRIFCISEYTRGKLLEYCPLPPAKLVVLPNGLDTYFDIADSPEPPARPPIIATISRLTRFDVYKGIDTLIQAMPQIRTAVPGVRLRVMGQGDDLPRLRELADQLGLQSAVEFLGFVSDEELQAQLRQCALFALPSKKEGFGLVFLEAMAQGRPCLGAQAGGIPEVLTPETGILVEYGDVSQIAAGCVAALQRPWDTRAILDRAREFAYPRFRERLATLLAI